ncbi:MAG: hypothetical protein Q8L02_00805 [Candidatus Nitrotoga sp.]|nr:hypothetical protein [Candidatus Nitrotoga sp.]
MSKVSYYFLPWVRYGLWKSAHENNQSLPELGENAGLAQIPERVKIPVKLKLLKKNENEADGTAVDGVNLSLFGPGDVVGIDSREIVRTEPRHLTPDFLPNLFPFIEFDRPDFPWLFTPGKQDANDCLLPWIVLVVLPKEKGNITTDPTKPSPEMQCPVSELPDLKESWAWAHAQYIGDSAQNQENIPKQLASLPHLNVSRLLCPRKLKPNEHYLACVVPAFKVTESKSQDGVVARKLEPAWKQSDVDVVGLPVYYQWEFSTAAEGDFEDFIARLKKPDQLDEKIQETFFRRMDVSGLLGETATLDIISALELELETKPGQNSVDKQILDDAMRELKTRINDSQENTDNVPLPIYGSRYIPNNFSGIPSLNDDLPVWLRTLNTDPRYRVAAALGTQIIQRQQEQLMAAAWEQATGLDAVNQMMKQKQLGREVTNSFYKRLEKLTAATFMQITQPIADAVSHSVQSAILKNTAAHRNAKRVSEEPIKQNIEGKSILSACGRRMFRPHGRLIRQGIVSDEQKLQLKSYVASRIVISGPPSGPLSPIILDPVKVARTLRMKSLVPDDTFRDEMQARLDVSRGLQSLKMVTRAGEAPSAGDQDPLGAITDVPLSFPQPMYEPLRDLFQEMLIPGLDQIPNNSLVILKTNPAFIEAYLVGLNHEMSRELLWREFPTHLGRTYFQKFWDDRGSGKSDVDIDEIIKWNSELGKNIAGEKGDLWVLLIKGDLLMRYPNTIIYAQKNGQNTFPVLRVNPVPGVTLLGFSINPPPDQNDGWSFVIEEHPTETRFGLDISRDKDKSLTSWRQLAWTDIELYQPEPKHENDGHISLKAKAIQLSIPPEIDPQSPPLPTDDPVNPNYEIYRTWKRFDHEKKISWGLNSAHTAYITLQKPFRYIIPSSRWFKKN